MCRGFHVSRAEDGLRGCSWALRCALGQACTTTSVCMMGKLDSSPFPHHLQCPVQSFAPPLDLVGSPPHRPTAFAPPVDQQHTKQAAEILGMLTHAVDTAALYLFTSAFRRSTFNDGNAHPSLRIEATLRYHCLCSTFTKHVTQVSQAWMHHHHS